MTRSPEDHEPEPARRARPTAEIPEEDFPTETIMLPNLAEEDPDADAAPNPAAPEGQLGLRFVAHSEVGLIRKNNQDSGYASPQLLLVADGMGGAAAGDLASAIAVDSIGQVDTEIEPEHQLTELTEAIRTANTRIADFIADDHTLEGMGTTVTGALFDGQSLALAHIGDSRAYLYRDGVLERLTHDHSWVQSLVDEGKISDEEAAVHPHRSLLVKVLNGQPAADPDVTNVPLRLGDRLLFCSDGLCGLVEDDQLAEAIAEDDLGVGMDRMVSLALAEGGIDNITVIVAEVVDSDPTDQVLVLGAAAERGIPTVTPRQDPPAGGNIDDADPDPEDDIDDDEDEARYAPQAPNRRRFLRPLIGLVALVVIIVGAISAGYAWTQTQYFVGASDERVAIFQGLPDPVPGFSLSSVYEVQSLAVTSLPAAYQDQVRSNIEVSDLTAARQTVARLAEAAGRNEPEQPKQPESSPPPSPCSTTSPGTATFSPSPAPTC